MPTDPDFHDTAAAWLDGSGGGGTRQLLKELLRDSPEAVAEMAALAQTEAALQLSGFSAEQRCERVLRLIQPSAAVRVKRAVQRPVFRWSAAALLAAGGLWWVLSTGGGEQPVEARRKIPRPVEKVSPKVVPALVRAPDRPLPPDEDFHRRMKKFILPEFRATRVSLAEALMIAREAIGDIDREAVPDFTAAADLPDDLQVNLHLKYQPVEVLMDLIAIQTGTVITPAGKGYTVSVDRNAPAAGLRDSMEITAWAMRPFGERQGLSEIDSARIPPLTAMTGAALGETPDITGRDGLEGPGNLTIAATARTVKLLKRVLAAEYGAAPPGTWEWTLRAVDLDTPERLAGFNSVMPPSPPSGGHHLLSAAEFAAVLRALESDHELIPVMSEELVPRPGTVGRWSTAGGDPESQPDRNKVLSYLIRNGATGDRLNKMELEIVREETTPGATGPATVTSEESISTITMDDGQTLVVRGRGASGGEQAVFITGKKGSELPYGIPEPGKPGYVRSPFAADKGMVDVGGMKRGTRVACPYTGQHFRVP